MRGERIKYDIITVGGNTLDAFVKTEAELVHIKKKNPDHTVEDETCLAYPVGDKILIKHLQFEVGGGGTNTAVAFSRLGMKTGYIGKIGKDENGLKIFNLLKKERIDFLGALGDQSGYSVILDSTLDDRTILTFRGCNDDLGYNEIDLQGFETNWFYFATMINKSLETMKQLASYAQKKGIKIAFNTSPYLAKKGLETLKPIINASNILIVNREEAEMLTGIRDIKGMIKKLRQQAKEYVVITDGKHGACCYDGKKLYTAEPLPNLKVVETTGAGDAFSSAFTAAIMLGKNAEQALRAGFIEAETVIQAYGAKHILLTRKELLQKLLKDPRPVKIHNI